MTSGERDIRYQGSVIMNRGVQMTDALVCGGSPPLSRPDRSSNRSGVARRTTCHPQCVFCAKDPSSIFPSSRTTNCHPAGPERSEGSAPSVLPDRGSLVADIAGTRLDCRQGHTPLFPYHSLLLTYTIYRVTTYPPVHPSRCYSYRFRLAQHGITQCRGGHA